jgi:hypothetical protein
VAGRYPTRICRVAFPIEVEDPTAESLAVRAEPQPETLAA